MLPAGTRCPTSAPASSNCRSARSLPCIQKSSQMIEHIAGRHAMPRTPLFRPSQAGSA